MFKVDFISLFAIFGAFQGLIFALVFGFKDRAFANKIFALFLLATSVRIAKNIVVHLSSLNPELFISSDFWRITIYIGIVHQFAIGPLFLLYFLAKLQPDFRWHKKYLWHFLPYVGLLIISPFVQWSFWQYGGLFASYMSILIYYLFCIQVYVSKSEQVDQGTADWLKALLIAAGILLLVYSPALFHYMGYIGGAFLYTVAILGATYLISKGSRNFSFFHTKYESSPLSAKAARDIKARLEELITREKPYLNPELRLQGLSEQLAVKPHHLSRVINQEFGMSFSEYINTFRIKEAAQRLKAHDYKHLKIAALAYDCGFNSVPTFNTLFKKVYKITPSQYREQ